MLACVAPTIYEFPYSGKNRDGKPDVIKLFFRLKIVDTPVGKKASISFYMDDKYGTIDNTQRFQEFGLSATETIKCGLTFREIYLAFRLHESSLRKAVTSWLNLLSGLHLIELQLKSLFHKQGAHAPAHGTF